MSKAAAILSCWFIPVIVLAAMAPVYVIRISTFVDACLGNPIRHGAQISATGTSRFGKQQDTDQGMPPYRSRTTTHGRNMAGARGLWRATEKKHEGRRFLGKPIIRRGQFLHASSCRAMCISRIWASSWRARSRQPAAWPRNSTPSRWMTASPWAMTACSYSLPSRELIADSVEYMVNAHCADAMVCISNCDKDHPPGMLMAAMRLNIPAVFVSGGPMEAGKVVLDRQGGRRSTWSMRWGSGGRRSSYTDEQVAAIERSACPTCGSCSGHVHGELDELPDRGARACRCRAMAPRSPPMRPQAALRRSRGIWSSTSPSAITSRTTTACCRAMSPPRLPFEDPPPPMALDIAMGGLGPTPCCTSWPPAIEGEIDFDLDDIDALSRRVPCCAKVAPAKSPHVHMEDVHRGRPASWAILGELGTPRRPHQPRRARPCNA